MGNNLNDRDMNQIKKLTVIGKEGPIETVAVRLIGKTYRFRAGDGHSKESIRKAATKVNKTVAKWQKIFPTQEMSDILALLAFNMALDKETENPEQL